MIRFILALTLFCPAPQTDGGFARAIELAGDNQLVAALRAAESESDPLQRSQAMVYVLVRAGDLAGGLQAATEGLVEAPGDLWLLERRASIAISLREGNAAREALEELSQGVEDSGLEGVEREAWQATVAGFREQIASLQRGARDRVSAVRLARGTVTGIAIVLLLAFAYLAGARPGRGASGTSGSE